MRRLKNTIITLPVILVVLVPFAAWRFAVYCYSLDFPENFELVVSRCEDAKLLAVSPNGEDIVVEVQHPNHNILLINYITKERTRLPIVNPYRLTFITQEYLMHVRDGESVLLHLPSQRTYTLQFWDLDSKWPDGTPLAAFDRIYYLVTFDNVVAFDLDEQGRPTNSYRVTNSESFSFDNTWRDFDEFLIYNRIDYEMVLSNCGSIREGHSCLSYSGLYLADNSHVSNNHGWIVYFLTADFFPRKMPRSGFYGWTHDDKGLFFDFGHDYIIKDGPGGFLLPEWGKIPGGVGVIEVPEHLHRSP